MQKREAQPRTSVQLKRVDDNNNNPLSFTTDLLRRYKWPTSPSLRFRVSLYLKMQSHGLPFHNTIEMFEAELATDETLDHPLPPRATQHAEPMVHQLFRENGAFDCMRAVKEPEQANLNPYCSFDGSRRSR